MSRDHTPGWIEDVYDGELYKECLARFAGGREITASMLEELLVWRVSNDPAELNDTGTSWLPVLLTCMSLPPWLRRKMGAMHLGMLLPPGVGNLNLLMPYFLPHLGAGPTGIGIGGAGVHVPASPGRPHATNHHCAILFCSNDTRATPKANRMRQSPAKVGASTHAWLDGFTLNGTVGYLQAIRYLSRGHPLRAEWREAFKGAPDEIRSVAGQRAPTLKNAANIARRCRAVDQVDQTKESAHVVVHSVTHLVTVIMNVVTLAYLIGGSQSSWLLRHRSFCAGAARVGQLTLFHGLLRPCSHEQRPRYVQPHHALG
jgi:hypothetical protein